MGKKLRVGKGESVETGGTRINVTYISQNAQFRHLPQKLESNPIIVEAPPKATTGVVKANPRHQLPPLPIVLTNSFVCAANSTHFPKHRHNQPISTTTAYTAISYSAC